jgi:two-component system NtrC family response regulator
MIEKESIQRPRVLIIDDDEHVCSFLAEVFRRMEFEPVFRTRLSDGLQRLHAGGIEVLFLDVNLPDGSGLEALEMIKALPDAPEIIVITSDDDLAVAELAMKSKVWDYIPKKGAPKKYRDALKGAYEYRLENQSRPALKTIDRSAIIGENPIMAQCIHQIAKAASEDFPVLITGETGTGKELFARAIHKNSDRAFREFMVVDCAALPEHLVESTLFGHSKGAFTGADTQKPGLLEMADRGTLFLDEVGELPMDIQKKFLRALQEKKFRPVGGKKELESDFRVICATHRNLKTMVSDGEFREDLYFRILSMTIHLPPLKERKDDIRRLAEHRLMASAPNTKSVRLSKELLAELSLYDWPGNVRELMNTLDLIKAEAGDGITFFPFHLPEHIRAFNIRKKYGKPGSTDSYGDPIQSEQPVAFSFKSFKAHMEQAKMDYVKTLLVATQGDKKQACRISGLSMGHLYRLLQQYNLK